MAYGKELRQMSRLLRLTSELLGQIAGSGVHRGGEIERIALDVEVVADRLSRYVDSTAGPAVKQA